MRATGGDWPGVCWIAGGTTRNHGDHRRAVTRGVGVCAWALPMASASSMAITAASGTSPSRRAHCASAAAFETRARERRQLASRWPRASRTWRSSPSPRPRCRKPSVPLARLPPTTCSQRIVLLRSAPPATRHPPHCSTRLAQLHLQPVADGPAVAVPLPTLRQTRPLSQRLTITASSRPSPFRVDHHAAAALVVQQPGPRRPTPGSALASAQQQVARVETQKSAIWPMLPSRRTGRQAVVVDVGELRVPGGGRVHVAGMRPGAR